MEEHPATRPQVIEVLPANILALTVEEAGRVNRLLQDLVPDEWVRDEDWNIVSRINHWCRAHPDL